MKYKVFIISFFLALVLFAQFNPPTYKSLKNAPIHLNKGVMDFSPELSRLAESVSYDSIYSTLSWLESQGIRNSGSGNVTLNIVRDKLVQQLESYGYTPWLQDVVVNGTNYGQNIIIEKPGNLYPDRKIVIGAHYDGVPYGPAVNDNGSGVAALLETARILSNETTDYSIIFILFTGEEHGLYGSQVYANYADANNIDIRLMFNLDQIGGISNYNGSPYEMTTITCERDERGSTANNAASSAYTDTLAMITNTYTSLQTVISYAYGSDYLPFESKGWVITGYYEYVPEDNPYYHSANDNLTNMDVAYLEQVTKGAVSFTGHVAGLSENFLVLHHQQPNTTDMIDIPIPIDLMISSSSPVQSVQLFWSTDSSSFTAINMEYTSSNGDTLIYSGEIPGQPAGTTVYYYFDAFNTDGVEARLPENGAFSIPIFYDNTAPSVQFEPFEIVGIYDFPLLVELDADDENGIDSVYIQYSINHGIDLKALFDPIGNSKFHLAWAPDIVERDTIYYQIIVSDKSTGHNRTVLPAPDSSYMLTIFPSLFTNFENEPLEYQLSGDWMWTDQQSNDPAPWSGSFMVGTNPGTVYSPNQNSILLSPVFSFSGTEKPVRLSFYHHYSLESNDGGNVKISINGSDFAILEPIRGYSSESIYASGEPGWTGNSYQWIRADFDLPDADTIQTLQFSWNLTSDYFTQLQGWYLDNITLYYSGESATTTGDQDATGSYVPNTFEVSQAYPNPFNPATTFEFSLPKPGKIVLEAYNMLGELVDKLTDHYSQAGTYKLKWSAHQLSTGIYFIRIRFNDYPVQTRKVILIK